MFHKGNSPVSGEWGRYTGLLLPLVCMLIAIPLATFDSLGEPLSLDDSREAARIADIAMAGVREYLSEVPYSNITEGMVAERAREITTRTAAMRDAWSVES